MLPTSVTRAISTEPLLEEAAVEEAAVEEAAVDEALDEEAVEEEFPQPAKAAIIATDSNARLFSYYDENPFFADDRAAVFKLCETTCKTAYSFSNTDKLARILFR